MRFDPFAVRRLPVGVVLAALVVALGLAIVCNAVLFQSSATVAVIDATGGWVSGTLLANALLLLVVVYGLLVRVGGASARDLGLHRADVLPAVVVTVGIWLVLNAAQAAMGFASGEDVAVSPTFLGTWRQQLATLLGQVLGNALFEEVLFRGVLVVQAARWFARVDGPLRQRDIVLGLLASQAWFALQHVPNRLAFDLWGGCLEALVDLGLLWFSGLCFAVLWLRTGNLLLAVGFHALGNCPCLVMAGPEWGHAVTLFVVLLALVGFGPRHAWLRGRGADAD